MKTIIAILFLGFTANSFAQDQNSKKKSLVIEKPQVAPVKKNPPSSTSTTPKEQVTTKSKTKRSVINKKQLEPARTAPSNEQR